VEVGNNLAAAVEGEAMAVENKATMLVDSCFIGENMVEVVRIVCGLREDKMGNVAWGGNCKVLKYNYYFSM
jgi:hypothetical protein